MVHVGVQTSLTIDKTLIESWKNARKKYVD